MGDLRVPQPDMADAKKKPVAKKVVTVPKKAPRAPKPKVKETVKVPRETRPDPVTFTAALDAALALKGAVPADENLVARFLVLDAAVESVKQGIESHARRLSRA